MVVEKMVYEVNGRIFEDKEEALRYEKEFNEEYNSVASKILDILDAVRQIAISIDTEGVFSISINVKDKQLMPEWYVNKKYYNVFVKLLDNLNVKYNADNGGNYSTPKFTIYPTYIEESLYHGEIVDFIKDNIKE